MSTEAHIVLLGRCRIEIGTPNGVITHPNDDIAGIWLNKGEADHLNSIAITLTSGKVEVYTPEELVVEEWFMPLYSLHTTNQSHISTQVTMRYLRRVGEKL